MENSKFKEKDAFSQAKQVINKLPRVVFGFIERRLGRRMTIFFAVGLLLFVGFIYSPLFGIALDFIKKEKPLPVEQKTQESSLERERVLSISESPCGGMSVDIIQEFSDVSGKEKLVQTDEDDPNVVAAPSDGNYQGVKRYPFECSLPWIATFSAIPRKDSSIGIFLEFEEVFKVLIGDGDRINWKVEKNDQGRKGVWTEVIREKLTKGKISIDRQMTIVIEARFIERAVKLLFKINYVPEGGEYYVWEEHEDIQLQPKAINLETNPSQKFRIGINDWRFKGQGSEVKLGTFSIKELK